MTFTLANPPLTAERPECGEQRAVFSPHDFYLPILELSRSRRYCIGDGGCHRKTRWVFRYPDLGPYAVTRLCWQHMSDTERAVLRGSF